MYRASSFVGLGFFVIESFSGNGIGTLHILFKEWHWILRDEQMSMRNDRGLKWLG